MSNKWGVDLSRYHNCQCPRCARAGRDTSKDNLTVYGEGKGAYCHACKFTILSDDEKVARGLDAEEDYEEDEVSTREPITQEENERIKSYTGPRSKGWRGIRDESNVPYGIRYSYDEETGEPDKMFVPTTIADKLVGYKTRVFPKDFRNPIGVTGKDCQLFGQFRYKTGGRTVVIVGGEVDMVSAEQMLFDYQKDKEYQRVAVVAPTTGENCAKQIQAQYEFFNSFEKIVLGLDNDDAGRKAMQEAALVLPKGKVHIAEWSRKDPNKMLTDGLQKQFISDYFRAKPFVPDGIVGSGGLLGKIREQALIPKIPLPPFMHRVQKLMAGGIPLGVIVNLASASGCVDKDTEYLTPSGWKTFDTYSVGDKVAQYHDDGSVTFVEPLEYVKKPCETMTRIRNRSTDQVLSDEHRFVYYPTKQSKKHKVLPFSDVKKRHLANSTGFRGLIATSFKYSGEGLDMTEGELRLQVAVMADGRITKEGVDNYTQMRFSKKRKYDRLLELCNKHSLRFQDNGTKPANYLSGVEYEVIVWPKTDDKSFSSKYYGCTAEQLAIICDEVMHWDGYVENQVYTSTRKGDVDFLQFAYAATGKRSVVGEDPRTEKYKGGYCGVLSVNSGSQFVSIATGGGGDKVELQDYKTVDGFKYCFMVPTGMLVLRRGGRIFITGNTGKSTIIDECTYFWVFNSPHRIGVITMESDSGQYGTKILSRHMGRKIDLIEDVDEKLAFLDDPATIAASEHLFKNEDGSDRWHLIEDRDGGLESLKALIMQLIIQCECKVIIIDPVQDMLEGLTNEDQAKFCGWMKGVIKSHMVTFVNVNHVRKSGAGQKANSTGADMHEEDIFGSGSLIKSAACNLLFSRDKEAEDDIEKNTTYMKASKCRWTGKTGVAGEYYYDGETHTMHDKNDWMAASQRVPEFTN